MKVTGKKERRVRRRRASSIFPLRNYRSCPTGGTRREAQSCYCRLLNCRRDTGYFVVLSKCFRKLPLPKDRRSVRASSGSRKESRRDHKAVFKLLRVEWHGHLRAKSTETLYELATLYAWFLHSGNREQ